MDISALCPDDITEDSSLSHCQGIHLVFVITTILQDEAVQACLLGKVNQAPTLLQIHSTWYLYGCVLTMLHRKFGHRIVMVPIGGNVNQINVIALT